MSTVAVGTPVRRRRAGTVALVVAQVLLALVVGSGGAMKLAADPVMVSLFDDIGAGQGLRVLVGSLEVAGAVGLLVPRLATLAALGLTLLLLGATATNVLVLDASPVSAAVLALAAGAVTVVRRRRSPGTPSRVGARRVGARP